MYDLEMNDSTDLSVVNYCMIGAELIDEQLDALKKSIQKKKTIWEVEMGLGKTYMVIGFINHLLPFMRENNKKCILVAPTNKTVDFNNSLTQYTNAKVLVSTGDKKQVDFLIKNWDKYDVFIVTQSAWTLSMDFNIWMFNNRYNIYACIYDEAQGVNDYGYLHFIKMCKSTCNYVALLNATPVGSTTTFSNNTDDKLVVFYNLIQAVGVNVQTYKKFYNKYTNNIEKNHFNQPIRVIDVDKIRYDFGKYLINFNRQDLNINTIYKSCIFHRCILSNAQRFALSNSDNYDGADINSVLYSPETRNLFPLTVQNVPALKELIDIIQKYDRDSNKIVYVKNQSSLITIYNYLKAIDYMVFILDGQHTSNDREKSVVEKLYNESKGGIIITTIDRGSNLTSASHVIIYDTPPDTLQFIARAVRGFVAKEITLDWIYYPEYERDKMIGVYEMIATVSGLTDRDIGVLPFLQSEIKCMYPDNKLLKFFSNKY